MRRQLTVLALLAAACSAPHDETLTPAQAQVVRDSVTAAMRGYEAAFTSLDAARITAFYSTDTAFRVVEGQTVFNQQAVKDLLTGMLPTLKTYGGGFNYDSLHIVPLSATTAAAIAPYVDILTDTAGVVTRMNGSVLWLWRRESAGWRIIAGQAAATPPVVTKP